MSYEMRSHNTTNTITLEGAHDRHKKQILTTQVMKNQQSYLFVIDHDEIPQLHIQPAGFTRELNKIEET